MLWSSEPATERAAREAVLTAVYRAAYWNRHGFAHTLREMLAQEGDQLGVDVKVVFDGSLARPGDEQQPANPGEGQLLDDVLHDRLAADREHFLGLALRRR